MTTVTRSFRHASPSEAARAQVIDVRCSAKLPARRSKEGRCQLFAGHDGPHAVMFVRKGARLVSTWRGGAEPVETDYMQRPWMFGFPVPAWSEPVPSDASHPDLTAQSGRRSHRRT